MRQYGIEARVYAHIDQILEKLNQVSEALKNHDDLESAIEYINQRLQIPWKYTNQKDYDTRRYDTIYYPSLSLFRSYNSLDINKLEDLLKTKNIEEFKDQVNTFREIKSIAWTLERFLNDQGPEDSHITFDASLVTIRLLAAIHKMKDGFEEDSFENITTFDEYRFSRVLRLTLKEQKSLARKELVNLLRKYGDVGLFKEEYRITKSDISNIGNIEIWHDNGSLLSSVYFEDESPIASIINEKLRLNINIPESKRLQSLGFPLDQLISHPFTSQLGLIVERIDDHILNGKHLLSVRTDAWRREKLIPLIVQRKEIECGK